MGPQFNTLLGGCSSAALSACLGGLARWTRRLVGREGAHGRSFPRSKGGRARTGRTPTGGLGSMSSTASLSRRVTQTWLGERCWEAWAPTVGTRVGTPAFDGEAPRRKPLEQWFGSFLAAELKMQYPLTFRNGRLLLSGVAAKGTS